MEYLYRILTLFLVFLLYSSGGQGQQMVSRVYSTEDGLPFLEVENPFIDSKGYLWVSSPGGYISRFDGKYFENFSSKVTGITGGTGNISEDENGIWFSSLFGTGKLGLYKGGKWILFDVGERLGRKIIPVHYESPKTIVDSTGTLYSFDKEQSDFVEQGKIHLPMPLPEGYQFYIRKMSREVYKLHFSPLQRRVSVTYPIYEWVSKDCIVINKSPLNMLLLIPFMNGYPKTLLKKRKRFGRCQ